jgi:GTP-binding protein YchF
VARQFTEDSVSHPLESVNPVRDIEFFETEFLLSDLSLVEKRLEKIEKDVQKSKNEQLIRELPVFKKLSHHLEKELPLRQLHLDENERRTIAGYQFLTIKPLIIGLNLSESDKESEEVLVQQLTEKFSAQGFPVIPFFAEFEYELSRLSEEEAELFKMEFGISDSTLARILQSVYSLLGLHSFFTVGEDECRAWTIRKRMTAQDAAGTIHTDFYNKFIRAEVVHYEDYIKHGSFAKCKESGAWRLEGKEYIVQDGDILNIRHS